MAPIMNRTPLATIAFKDGNGYHIRVYYQDLTGQIRETFYDDGRGWNKRDGDIVGQGKLNTAIAATQWSSGTEIRVYFISPKGTLVERCYSGSKGGQWFDGALTNANIKTAPYSQIAAVPFSLATYDARVYFQCEDNKIGEAVLEPSREQWSFNQMDLPASMPATSLSAVCSSERSDQRVWLYYQKLTTEPVEYLLRSNKVWSLGGYKPKGTFAPGACLSATHFGNYHIRVYAINDQNELVQTKWDIDTAWGETRTIARGITFSSVAAAYLPASTGALRVYNQPLGQTVSEQGSDDGGASFITMQQTIPVDRG